MQWRVQNYIAEIKRADNKIHKLIYRIKMSRKLTRDQFIERSRIVHKDKYDYSYSQYVGASYKVEIICPIHGFFSQQPFSHLEGRGCPQCGGITKAVKRKYTLSSFIVKAKKIHNNKYDYSKVNYIHNRVKTCIVCPKHGNFFQKPNCHLAGRGCPQCARELTSQIHQYTSNIFIEQANKVHNNRYDYSKVFYKTSKIKVCIICLKHGEFWQDPASHLRGNGCPFCRLKSEGEIYVILIKYFPISCIIHRKKIWESYQGYNHRRFCDFWLEKDNIKVMVEYDGQQHFMPVLFGGQVHKRQSIEIFKKQKLVHKLDKQFCKENNIILFRIKYTDNKEEKIIQLKSILESRCSKYGT